MSHNIILLQLQVTWKPWMDNVEASVLEFQSEDKGVMSVAFFYVCN